VATGSFGNLLQTMAQQDFFIGVLPFLLTYVIFFLALKRVPLFDQQDDDKMAGLVAVIAGLFVSYFLVQNPAFQTYFVQYFGRITIGLVGLLGLFVFLGFFGSPENYFNNSFYALIALVFVTVASALSGGLRAIGLGFVYDLQLGGIQLGAILENLLGSGLIGLLVVVAALWYTTTGGGNDGDDNGSKLGDVLGAMFQEVDND